MDKIRNEYSRETAQVGRFGEKTREARLSWYGYVRRKDDGYNGRRIHYINDICNVSNLVKFKLFRR